MKEPVAGAMEDEWISEGFEDISMLYKSSPKSPKSDEKQKNSEEQNWKNKVKNRYRSVNLKKYEEKWIDNRQKRERIYEDN